MDNFQRMVAIYSEKQEAKLKKFCQPLQDSFGINYFWYYKITNDGRYICFGSHVAWMEYYYSEKLYLLNPYLRHPSNYSTGISLIRRVNDQEFQDTMDLSMKRFNVNLNLVFMEKTDRFIQGYGFASKLDSYATESMYLAEWPLLRLFILRFKEEFQSLIDHTTDDLIDLSSFIGKTSFFDKKINLNPKLKERQTFLKSMGVYEVSGITPREKDLLRLVLKGYSAFQIALELGLSKRTIEYYLNNIKNKLTCNSKKELIQIARDFSDLGYLN